MIKKLNPLQKGALIFIALIVVYMLVRAFIPANFEVNSTALFNDEAYKASVNIADFINESEKADNDLLIIDLRDKKEFDADHFEGTVNMPESTILKKRNLRKMKKHEVWLISGSEMVSNDIAFLLYQLGYDARPVNGDYELIKKWKENFNPVYGNYSNEKQKFDYPRYIKQDDQIVPEFKSEDKKQISGQGGC